MYGYEGSIMKQIFTSTVENKLSEIITESKYHTGANKSSLTKASDTVRAPTSYVCGLPEVITKHKHISVPS